MGMSNDGPVWTIGMSDDGLVRTGCAQRLQGSSYWTGVINSSDQQVSGTSLTHWGANIPGTMATFTLQPPIERHLQAGCKKRQGLPGEHSAYSLLSTQSLMPGQCITEVHTSMLSRTRAVHVHRRHAWDLLSFQLVCLLNKRCFLWSSTARPAERHCPLQQKWQCRALSRAFPCLQNHALWPTCDQQQLSAAGSWPSAKPFLAGHSSHSGPAVAVLASKAYQPAVTMCYPKPTCIRGNMLENKAGASSSCAAVQHSHLGCCLLAQFGT